MCHELFPWRYKRKRGIITFLDKQGRRDSNPRQQFTSRRKETAKQRGLRAIEAFSFGEESRQRVEENAASWIEHPSCRTRNVISASFRFYNHPVTPSLCRSPAFATVQRTAKRGRKNWGKRDVLCRNSVKRTFEHCKLFFYLNSHWEMDISSIEYFIFNILYTYF